MPALVSCQRQYDTLLQQAGPAVNGRSKAAIVGTLAFAVLASACTTYAAVSALYVPSSGVEVGRALGTPAYLPAGQSRHTTWAATTDKAPPAGDSSYVPSAENSGDSPPRSAAVGRGLEDKSFSIFGVAPLVVAPLVGFLAALYGGRKAPYSMLAVAGEEQGQVETEPTTEPSSCTPLGFDFTKTLAMPGVIAPTGFFDPLDFAVSQSDEEIRYWREAEVKHGRVAMLAALGFLVAEKFHPLFGGNIGAPSAFAFQQTPLQTFWPLVLAAVGMVELRSIAEFKDPTKGAWELKPDYEMGNFGFDPLGLKPQDPQGLLEMKNKELSNGRLAMIAIAGMVSQELATRQPLFGGSVAMFATSSEKAEETSVALENGEASAPPPPPPKFDVTTMPGVLAPTGFFDPWSMAAPQPESKMMYWREAELKHGRVAMLAALGFPLAEKFHPLFGGNISTPSAFAFQQTPLQTFWPLVLLAVGLVELRSIATFKGLEDGTWELKNDHESGDLGFDPLGLKPKTPSELLDVQNRELSNGRLAMIAIVGMIVQEVIFRTPLL